MHDCSGLKNIMLDTSTHLRKTSLFLKNCFATQALANSERCFWAPGPGRKSNPRPSDLLVYIYIWSDFQLGKLKENCFATQALANSEKRWLSLGSSMVVRASYRRSVGWGWGVVVPDFPLGELVYNCELQCITFCLNFFKNMYFVTLYLWST